MLTAEATSEHWQGIHSTAREFRQTYHRFESFMDDLFDELDLLRQEYARKLGELDAERRKGREAEEELVRQRELTSRLTHDLEQNEAQLTQLREQLAAAEQAAEAAQAAQRELQQQHESVRSELESFQENAERLRQELEQLQQEHSSMKDELQQWEARHAAAESARLEAEEARDELRRELEQRSQDEGDSAARWRQQNDELRQQVETLQRQLEAARKPSEESAGVDTAELEALRWERDELAEELERVRSRAAELESQLASSREELDEQHASLTRELRELRQMVQSASSPQVTPQPVATAARSSQSPAAPRPDEHVVNSVMAQFAKLQRDARKRRNQAS